MELPSSRGGEVGRGGGLSGLGGIADKVPHKALGEEAVKLDIRVVLPGEGEPEVTSSTRTRPFHPSPLPPG